MTYKVAARLVVACVYFCDRFACLNVGVEDLVISMSIGKNEQILA